MTPRSADVLVIGAGLAGLTAAVRAAEGGAKVLVLAKGVGSTHLGPGTVDVLGYDPGPVASPADALERLIAARPDHPYARVGVDGVAAALEWLRERVASGPLAPYAYGGGLEDNLLLPTAVGVAKPTALAPQTMLAGDVRAPGAQFCIVGFRQLKDFHATLAADNLNAAHGASVQARGFELDVAVGGRADLNALGLAKQLQAPEVRRLLAGRLAERLRAGERVGLPAVLGLDDPHGVWSDLEHRLGRPVFEIPTLPPSVTGMRLFATLRAALRAAGGRMVMSPEVIGPAGGGPRLDGVRARVGLREVVHRAGEIVLATGGFASGGLAVDSRWQARDRALGLPLAHVPGEGEPRFTPSYFDEQPMARAGIAVDDELRPVGARGEPIYENVRVAGASLAGAIPWKEKSGDGISLATGHRAAELILQAAGATLEAR